MERLKIFCECEFLDQFIEDYKLLSFNDLSVRDGYDNFWKLLGSKVELILDVEPEHFLGKVNSNPFYQYIANQSSQSQNVLSFDPKVFNSIKEKNIDFKESLKGNELILVSQNADTAAAIQEFFEVIVISIEEIREKTPKLFFSSSFSIKKGETQKKDFDSFIKSFVLHPTHFVFFNDQYLLNSRHGKVPLLDLIALFTEDQRNTRLIVSARYCDNLTSLFNDLTSLLKNTLFTLFKGEIHNRLIFTNYYWGMAGHSLFSFPKGRADKNDFIEFKSIFNPKKENNGITGYELYSSEIGEFYKEYNHKKRLESLEPYFKTNDTGLT